MPRQTGFFIGLISDEIFYESRRKRPLPVTFPLKATTPRVLMYRFMIGVSVAILFAIQPLARTLPNGGAREAAGYIVSTLFLAAIAEFATLALGKTFARTTVLSNSVASPKALLTLASALLCLNIFSKKLSGYLPLPHRGPPTIPLLILIGAWLAALWYVARFGWSKRSAFIALGVLVLGTRFLVLGASPFDRLTGDMLANIDQSLDVLFLGRFPYAVQPLPMPYLTVTFLAYAPAKLLGIDLRHTNLVLDVAAVALTIF